MGSMEKKTTLDFDIDVLQAGGYKMKKLQNWCKKYGLNSRGTSEKMINRLAYYYQTRPGNFKPDNCIRFKFQMEFNYQARTISNALLAGEDKDPL